MRQVLFRIPLDGSWLGLPVFGFGWLLLAWVVASVIIVRMVLASTRPQVAGGPDGNMAGPPGRSLQDWIPFAVQWAIVAGLIVLAPTKGRELMPEGIPIFGYGAMLLMGFLAGAWLAAHRARAEGLDPELIWDLTAWIFIPGILGGRVFYLIQYGHKVFANVPPSQIPFKAINLSEGGLVLYGGVIGGLIGYLLFCYLRRVNPLQLGDVITPAVFIGVGFGRIGCLLNGCCWGDPCELPWAISFPPGSAAFGSMVEKGLLMPAAAGTPGLHPTQIYSAIDGFFIAALTIWYTPYRQRRGEVMAIGWLMYPITRFFIELLRGDESGQFSTSLTISQWVSIALFASGLVYLAVISFRSPPAPPPQGGALRPRRIKTGVNL